MEPGDQEQAAAVPEADQEAQDQVVEADQVPEGEVVEQAVVILLKKGLVFIIYTCLILNRMGGVLRLIALEGVTR